MVTEMITLKLDDIFLKEIDGIVKSKGYQNRTEFIRSALRTKVDDEKLKEAMRQIAHLRGAVPWKTTDEDLERTREKVFRELDKTS